MHIWKVENKKPNSIRNNMLKERKKYLKDFNVALRFQGVCIYSLYIKWARKCERSISVLELGGEMRQRWGVLPWTMKEKEALTWYVLLVIQAEERTEIFDNCQQKWSPSGKLLSGEKQKIWWDSVQNSPSTAATPVLKKNLEQDQMSG